jgi:type IV fimbrial biogenesis protein FimT
MTIFEGREMKNGFTLIELLITLAIAAILLTTAIPSFREIIRNNQLTTQANNLVTALHLARSEAVKRRTRVAVCAGTTAAGCTGGWNDGWIVFVDADGGCDYDAGTDVILRASGGLQEGAAMAAAPACLGFQRSGYSTSNAAETFTLCNSSVGKSRVMTVEGVGHIRTTTGSC